MILILPTLCYKYNIIPIKIPTGYFFGTRQVNPKFICKNKHVTITRKILGEKKANGCGN